MNNLNLNSCPRCGGAIEDRRPYDEPTCLTCGFRAVEVTSDVQREVAERAGLDTIPWWEHKVIGTGVEDDSAERYRQNRLREGYQYSLGMELTG